MASGVAPVKSSRPSSSFSINVIDSCINSVQFSLNVSNPQSNTNYIWSSDSSVQISTPNQNSSPAIATSIGKKWIRLKSRRGFRRNNRYDSLTIYPNPNISADTITTCDNQLTSISTTISDCFSCSYQWSTGDTTPVINKIYSASTTVGLRVTNEHGCSDSSSLYIDVSPLPSISTSLDSISMCRGDSVTFSASSDQSVNYVWSTGDSTSAIKISPLNSGSHTVYCYNSYGCLSDTISVYVTIHDNPSISMESQIWLCLENDYTVTPTVLCFGNPSYSWSSGGSMPSITLQPGNYTEYLTVTDGRGCISFDSVKVDVNEFEVEILSVPELCFGDTIPLDMNTTLGNSGYNVRWEYNGDTLKSTTEISLPWLFKPMISDTLRAFVTSDSVCQRTLTKYIRVNTLPVNDFDSLNSEYSNLDTVFLRSVIRDTSNDYSYYLNGQFYSSKMDTMWLPFDTGSYTFELLSIDPKGCIHSILKNLKIRNFSDRDVLNIAYPNPADNSLNLVFNATNGEKYILTIQDMNGRVIQESGIQSNSQRESVEVITQNIPNGEYLINITDQSGQVILSKRIGVVH